MDSILLGANAEMVSCHDMIDAGACNLRKMARDLGAYLHLRDLNEGRSFMRVTAINRIKKAVKGGGKENTNQGCCVWCEV